MPSISNAGCPGLSWMVSAQFTPKMCILQPKIAKNSLKAPILGVQGRSRSLVLVPLESSLAVLVMISSKSVSICNRFQARWANSGKITISKGGTPLWCPRSRGISSPSSTKLPHKKVDTLCYHMVKTRSLYLTWHWIRTGSWPWSWRTDRRTDIIPIANTRSQQYLPVQLARVKINKIFREKNPLTKKLRQFHTYVFHHSTNVITS